MSECGGPFKPLPWQGGAQPPYSLFFGADRDSIVRFARSPKAGEAAMANMLLETMFEGDKVTVAIKKAIRQARSDAERERLEEELRDWWLDFNDPISGPNS
jgi:hypothetical protein